MGPAVNYSKETERIIKELGEYGRERLLIHACCAPCSSYVLEYLSEYFDITVFYYNPNISPREEYEKRCAEIKRLTEEMPVRFPVKLVFGKYDPERYYETVSGLENEPEGGRRCEKCFRLRLEEAAMAAAEGKFDYFTTTLTISPLKNARLLNELGEEYAGKYGVKWLPSDFKKKDGFKRSVELSARYGLYRQNYCGCEFSRNAGLPKEGGL